jgi:hypothetical protein
LSPNAKSRSAQTIRVGRCSSRFDFVARDEAGAGVAGLGLGELRSRWARYQARAGQRHAGHLDTAHAGDELWGRARRPLGFGTVVEVDPSGSVDIVQLAARLAHVLAAS